MTTAPQRGGEAAPIGHLIQRIERDLQRPQPMAPGPLIKPQELKARLMGALGTIRRLNPGTLGVTRAEMRHLIELIACTARDDLAAGGGLLGGSNGYYATRLSVQPATVTTIFRALRCAGLIEPHNPTANHRRSCHRTPDGHRDGRGYTLRPTVERLSEIEAIAARLEDECSHMAAIIFETRNLLAEAAGLAASLPSPSTDLATEIETLQGEAKRLRVFSPISEGRGLLARAVQARKAAYNLVKTSLSMSQNRDQTRENSRQHHTAEQPDLVSVFARRGGSSGTGGVLDPAEAPAESLVQEGTTQTATIDHDLTCGLTRAEARVLFPETRDYIPATDAHEACIVSATALSHRLRINPRLLGRSFETMGIARTLWSLHLVHKRMNAGQIERDAAAYFNGMVTRALKGQLDIDRSIWGLRSALSDTSPKRQGA